jgi:hypothetical protein
MSAAAPAIGQAEIKSTCERESRFRSTGRRAEAAVSATCRMVGSSACGRSVFCPLPS